MDSIHVATAIHMRCGEFLTRDTGILQHRERLAALGLSVIAPLQTMILPDKFRQDDFEHSLAYPERPASLIGDPESILKITDANVPDEGRVE